MRGHRDEYLLGEKTEARSKKSEEFLLELSEILNIFAPT